MDGVFQVMRGTVGPFMRRSTIGGLNNSARSNHYFWTLWWIVLFCVGVIVTSIQINSIMQDYLEYHVSISSDLQYVPALAFPAVTICNLNRVNCLNLYTKWQNLTTEYNLTMDSNLQDDIQKLQAMYLQVGCDLQACTVYSDDIPDVRDSENYDWAAIAYAMFQCQNVFVEPAMQYINAKNCYYLHQMIHYDPAYDNSTEAYYEELFVSTNCSVSQACTHYLTKILPLVASGVFAIEYTTGDELGADCLPSGNNSSTEGNTTTTNTTDNKRRKRQAGFDLGKEEIIYTYNISKLENEFLPRFMALDPSLRMSTGNLFPNVDMALLQWYQPGMITTCTFLGEDCKVEELWYQFTDPTYGNCFSFNWAAGDSNSTNATAVRNVTLTGASNGLQLELFVDQFNYMEYGLSPQAGFRIVVHDPNDYPLMDEEGLDLQPATLTSVAVSLTNITRLPDPYEAHCLDFWNQTTLDEDIMSDNRPAYSMSVCNRFCIQVDIISTCDCYHIQLDMTLINISRVHFKNGTDPCELMPMASNLDYGCFQAVLKEYEEGIKDCSSCHLACSETVYSITTSTATWPSRNFWTSLAKYEQGYSDSQLQDTTIGPKIQQIIKDNYLKVEIYYQSLNVQEIIQTPKVSSSDLFASLGGALALYLGIAVIMFFEFLELLVLLALTIYDRYREKDEDDPDGNKKREGLMKLYNMTNSSRQAWEY